MTQSELLQRIKERLQDLYGERFRGLVLYGSVARGDDRPDSDIDLLALLDGPIDVSRETWNISGALYPLKLQCDERSFHVIPADAERYLRGVYSLYREVRREGVPV